MPQKDDPVRVGVSLFQVMRGEQHGPAPGRVLPDRSPEAAPPLDVHAGGRLVQDQQFRVGQQGHGEAQPLLLTAGALAHPAVGDAGDTGPVQRLVDRPRPDEQARGVLRGLPHGEVLEQAAGLQHGGDEPAGDGVPRRHPEHVRRARGGLGQPQDDVDGRGLPRAVGPEERDNLPRRDIQVDALHRLDRAEILAYPAQGDCGRLAPRSGPAPPFVRRVRYRHAPIVAPAPPAPKSSVSRRVHDNCHGAADAGAAALS